VIGALARAGFRAVLRGAHNLPSPDPAGGPAIIVANHTSRSDVMVVVSVLRRSGLWIDPPCRRGCAPGHRHIKVLATDYLWDYPVLSSLARRSGAIPVADGNGTPALLAAKRAIDAGEVVLIYPEGDVQARHDARPRTWLGGAVALAALGVPVHPVAHHDARALGGTGSVVSNLLWGITGLVRVPLIRVYAGPPVRLDRSSGSGRSRLEQQALLEGALLGAWEVVRSGVLPCVDARGQGAGQAGTGPGT